MSRCEFERIGEEVSKNIIGIASHILDFEEGQPLELLHLDLALEKIIEHALAPVEYTGEPMKLDNTAYVTGKSYPFMRECALKKIGEEIFLDLTEDELREEQLLKCYLPYFESIARNMGPHLYSSGIAQFIPLDANDLLTFLCAEDEPLPEDYKWRGFTVPGKNLERYRINKDIGCLERTSTFQKLFSDRENVQYHTHFVIDDDKAALALSGSDIEIYNRDRFGKKPFGPCGDLSYVRVRGEQGAIYIRLDKQDITLIRKSNLQKKNIREIVEKNLDHTLLGVAMTFNSYEIGGKYTLFPITFRN